MKEWIVVACRAEAKIFERHNKAEDLHWLKTMTHKKGRLKERDFTRDEAGISYAKFGFGAAPHRLEGHSKHTEIEAWCFAQQIAKFIEKSHGLKSFNELTVFAGAHFLGLLKAELSALGRSVNIKFIPKNIEKAQTEHIAHYLD